MRYFSERIDEVLSSILDFNAQIGNRFIERGFMDPYIFLAFNQHRKLVNSR